MAKFTVDGPNLLLIAQAGVRDVDVQVDLYSDAKEHWLTDSDNRFNFPFRTIAGDPIRAGVIFSDAYFLQNGWKIRPDEADHSLVFTGNLFLDAGEVGDIIVPTLGAFTVLAEIERSTDPRSLFDSTADCHMGTSYVPGSNLVRMSVWLERSGVVVTSGLVSATVNWYVPVTGALLFTVTNVLPDAQGNFDIEVAQSLADDTAYYADVIVTDANGPVSRRRAVPTAGT